MAERARILRPSPPDILKSLGTKAMQVRQAAEKVSVTLDTFCAKLAKVPGRLEAEVYGSHPDSRDDNAIVMALWFHKHEGKWVISWAEWDRTDEEDDDFSKPWKLLSDAPLRIKVSAVKILPDLLAAMEEEQDELIDDYTSADAKLLKLIEDIDALKKEAQ